METSRAEHVETNLEKVETTGINAAMALDVIHQQSKETVSEPYRLGAASKFAKTVNTHDAKNQIPTLIQPAFPMLNVCDERFLCRIAKKLGCQFCAEK